MEFKFEMSIDIDIALGIDFGGFAGFLVRGAILNMIREAIANGVDAIGMSLIGVFIALIERLKHRVERRLRYGWSPLALYIGSIGQADACQRSEKDTQLSHGGFLRPLFTVGTPAKQTVCA